MVLATIVALTCGGYAFAQSNGRTDAPKASSSTDIGELVSSLDERQKEALARFIEVLGQPTGASEFATEIDGPGFVETIQKTASDFGVFFVGRIVHLPEFLLQVGDGVSAIFAGSDLTSSIALLAFAAISIAIGIAAEFVFNRIVARWRVKIDQPVTGSLGQTMRTLSLRIAVELGGLTAFAVFGLLAAKVIISEPIVFFLVSDFLILAIIIARVMAAILRFVLAPKRSDLRLVAANDQVALYIYRRISGLFVLVGIALFIVAASEKLGHPITSEFRFWVGLIASLWIIWVTWQSRKGLESIIIGAETNVTLTLERMAAWWPFATMIIVALFWLLAQIVISTGSTTLSPANAVLAIALVVIAPFLETMVRSIARNLVPKANGEELDETTEKAREGTRRCYVRIGRTFLFAILILVIAKLWGVSLRGLAEAQLGDRIAANAVSALLIAIIGYLIWEFTNLWVSKRLMQEDPAGGGHAEAGGEGGGTGKSRLATILPLLQLVLQFTIITMTVLITLSQLGVNIAPLLAGAGVIGLAIGFGAQTLVKDIVSGAFFLMDDAFRIGEFIDANGTIGTVEKISIRSLQLRSARGPIHIVPYGEISKITNNSRDWVIMKLRFTVPFETDLDKVRKIFKKIGREIMENPELAEDLIEPFKSQGAADVDDVGIIIRGKFTAKPGRQFTIRKEVYSRVQKAFKENGIEFARKEVRVQIPGLNSDTNLSDEQKTVIAAAASQAAETTAANKPKKESADER